MQDLSKYYTNNFPDMNRLPLALANKAKLTDGEFTLLPSFEKCIIDFLSKRFFSPKLKKCCIALGFRINKLWTFIQNWK